MAIIQTGKAQVYWSTAADSVAIASGDLVAETRNWDISMSPDYADGTAHGDVFKIKTPTFMDFTVKVSGLYNDGATNSARVVTDAIAKTKGRYYLVFTAAGSLTVPYWYGHGYVAIDSNAAPYTDYSPFNFSITAQDQPTLKAS